MKLALVNNNYVLGGAETVVRQLHEGARAQGHESELWISDFKDAPRAPGVRMLYPRWLERLQHTRLRPTVQKWFPKRKWTDRKFRELGRSGADLVHVHAFHGIYAGMHSLATVARQVPLVWTFHRFWGVTGGCDHPGSCRRYLDVCGECPRVQEWPLNGRDNTAAQLAEKRAVLAPLPITIIAPSRHMLRAVQESPVGRQWRSHYIPNGVDLGRFHRAEVRDAAALAACGLPADRTLVLVVNRDFRDPVKGFGIIRDALAALAGRLEGVTIAMVGWNAQWACAQFPADVPAVPVGFVADRARLAALYNMADVFLYASPGENFPCAIIEAMAAECCIVSTPTDGVLEQVEHGQSGLLAVDFTGAALASQLAEALARPELRRTLGAAARARANAEFTEAVMVNRHLALYAELLEEAPR